MTRAAKRQNGFWWQLKRFSPLAALLLVTACATQPTTEPAAPQQLTLRPADYAALNLAAADMQGFAKAMHKSCPQLLKRGTQKPVMTTGADWQEFCSALRAATNPAAIQAAITTYLKPYQAFADDAPTGLFTGYYEPLLRGSLTRQGAFQTPLYQRPADLIEVNLGDFRDEWRGRRLAGRVDGKRLKPYYTRAEITNGALRHKNLELLYVDNPVDAFFLEIQGSGRVELPTGQHILVGYAAQNGHAYTAIGKVLKDKNELPNPQFGDKVTMQSIRAWLAANPQRQQEIFNTNPSYVFFQKLKTDGVVGAPNLVLTPRHSLAIDPAYYSYHLPLFVSLTLPDGKNFAEAMVAQDTGGAIRGAIRGDVFWGFGEVAEFYAGKMQQQGQQFVLLPTTVTP